MLQHSYIGVTPDTKNKIIGLVKKTAKSQFQIGVILNKIYDKKNELENKANNHFQSGDKKKYKKQLNLEWDSFIDSLPFGNKVANKFMNIAKDPMIKKYLDVAPIAYNTLDGMKGLAEEQWKFFIEKGMDSGSTAGEIAKWKKEYQVLTADPIEEEVEPTAEELAEDDAQLESLGIKKDYSNLKDTEFKHTPEDDYKDIINISANLGKLSLTEDMVTEIQELITNTLKEYLAGKGIDIGDTELKVGTNPFILTDENLSQTVGKTLMDAGKIAA